MKILGALVLCLLPSVAAADWADVIKQVERSVIYLDGDDGRCTAWVINVEKKYVMTAAHCETKGAIWADLVKGEPIALDRKKDLMILEVKNLDPTRPALVLADKNPHRGQAVMSIGYGYALDRPFFRQANIQDDQLSIPEGGVGGPFISTDAPFVTGQSGGPVVDDKGRVVSIVQRGDGGTTGIGVGVELIKERLGRFFGKATK